MSTPHAGPRLTGSERSLTGDERSIGQLVSDATQEISGIFKSEIELAKAEISSVASSGGKAVGMFIGAAIFGLFFLGFLLTAAVHALALTGLPLWACWLIVAGVLLLITGILAMLGLGALKKAKAAAQEKKTVEQAQATVKAVKAGQTSGQARVQTLKADIEAEKDAKEAAKLGDKAEHQAEKETRKARHAADPEAKKIEKQIQKEFKAEQA